MSIETIRFVADRGDARLRLDQVLVRRVSDVSRMSRSLAQRWIETGCITIDGRTARRSSSAIREGVTIEIALPPATPRRAPPEAQPATLSILYEDECIIAINKPPGVVVHPSYKQKSGTLLNGVLWRMRDNPDARPGILTRLDKDTSGIVVVALSPAVHAALQHDAAAGRTKKEYLAVVQGAPRPRRGRITHPLARAPHDRRRVIITGNGAPSETHYELLSSTGDLSLVRCELVTGRTHQIRVHLAAQGWPIVGDRLYGVPHADITRQALHAWRVTLVHPTTRRPLQLEAPLPDDMKRLFAAGLGL